MACPPESTRAHLDRDPSTTSTQKSVGIQFILNYIIQKFKIIMASTRQRCISLCEDDELDGPNVLAVVKRDPAAADFLISIFMAALNS